MEQAFQVQTAIFKRKKTMTDKLADALKALRAEYLELKGCYPPPYGRKEAYDAMKNADEAIAAHEAAKAATGDDARPFTASIKSDNYRRDYIHLNFGNTGLALYASPLVNRQSLERTVRDLNAAALRQGVTLPEVISVDDAEQVGFEGVPEHWQSPTARSVVRHVITAIERKGWRIVKGGA